MNCPKCAGCKSFSPGFDGTYSEPVYDADECQKIPRVGYLKTFPFKNGCKYFEAMPDSLKDGEKR